MLLERRAEMFTHGGGRLPPEYQEVEWIASDGNQYIKTNFIPNVNTKMYVKASTNIAQTNTTILGSNKASLGRPQISININASSYYMMQFTDNQAAGPKRAITSNVSAVDGNIHEIYGELNDLTVDGTSFTDSNLFAAAMTHPIYLFCLNNYGTATRKYIGDIYSVKIWNGATLRFDFIPCYRKADNVIGMYDMVTEIFYTNDGTGTFTKGGNV